MTNHGQPYWFIMAASDWEKVLQADSGTESFDSGGECNEYESLVFQLKFENNFDHVSFSRLT